MKSLYNKDYRYTQDAMDLDQQTFLALKNIWDKFIAMGYSPREISHVMQDSVRGDLELIQLL